MWIWKRAVKTVANNGKLCEYARTSGSAGKSNI